ncbi:MAG TPA: hypothetical protein VM008_06030 [Phycisphaerae bacterium]|nr:hypothetical protein [Phycisphaerae bacterium]
MTNTNPSPRNELTLAPEDAALVDALLEHGRPSTENLPASDRAVRVHAWLKTLDASPMPEPPGDLLDRTLSRLQSERMKLNPARIAAAAATTTAKAAPASPASAPRRGGGFKFITDLAAMAVAASLLGVVVCLGIFQARQSANRVACATNLQKFSTAFAAFAADHRGDLPALASTADNNWLNPNPAIPGSHTNAENLLPLVDGKFVQPANFVCAGRDLSGVPHDSDAARGYSYVNMFAVDHPGWDGQHANIILADRNPLFDASAPLDPQANSMNHAGHGNYALRADGTVTWETTPNVGPARDNIWTIGPGPQYQTRYRGTETPASEKDVFLAP